MGCRRVELSIARSNFFSPILALLLPLHILLVAISRDPWSAPPPTVDGVHREEAPLGFPRHLAVFLSVPPSGSSIVSPGAVGFLLLNAAMSYIDGATTTDTTVMPMLSLAPAFTYTQRRAKGLGRRC
jgi:hypothetical protein